MQRGLVPSLTFVFQVFIQPQSLQILKSLPHSTLDSNQASTITRNPTVDIQDVAEEAERDRVVRDRTFLQEVLALTLQMDEEHTTDHVAEEEVHHQRKEIIGNRIQTTFQQTLLQSLNLLEVTLFTYNTPETHSALIIQKSIHILKVLSVSRSRRCLFVLTLGFRRKRPS